MTLPPAGPHPAAAPTSAADAPPRLLLHMPVDVRSVSLAVLATLACVLALHWTRDVAAPLVSGMVLSYALNPLVVWLERVRVPRPVGATLVLSAVVGLLCWGTWALSAQVDAVIDTVPAVTQRLKQMSKRVAGEESTIERVRDAADKLTAAANVAVGASAPTPPVRGANRAAAAAVAQATPSHALDVRVFLWTGTLGALSLLSKLSIVLLMALFILAAGNSFRRKLVKIAGDSLTSKKITLQTLDDITAQIQRYLLVQVGVSAVVGVCTGLGFWAMGLNNAGAWGLAAGITNLVPYVGAAVLGAGAAVVALVQFGSMDQALMALGIALGIHFVVGNLLTPWWTGRASKMSPVAVFVAVVVFGWLWGAWGLLLGVPVLLAVKSVCDHVEDLQPVGELLGP